MATIRDLFVEIGLKVDDAPLKQFDRGIKRLEGNLRILRRGLLLVSAAGIAGFAFLIKKGGTLEQVEIGFETMLGSAEKAQELLAELFEFAKKTPFEIEGILGTSSMLIGMGFAAEDLIGILNDLGNIAAGLPNASLERLALNLGQVRSQTKLTGRELRDFAVAGVDLLGELAKILGKTTAEVRELVSQGKINFDLTRQAFANMAGEGGRFFNLMIRQSTTTFGIWSNIKDVITLLAQDLSKDILPIVKKLQKQFLDFLEINKQIIKLKFQKIIKEVIGGLKELFRILSGIGTSIGAVVEALGGLKRTIQLVTIALGILFGISTLSAIGNIVLAVGALTKAFIFMGRAGFIATLKVTALPLAVGLAVVVLILLLEDVASFFTGKKSLTGPLLKAFKEDYPAAFRKTKNELLFFKKVLDDVAEGFKIAFNFLPDLFKAIFEGAKLTATGIGKLFEGIFNLDIQKINQAIDIFSAGALTALTKSLNMGDIFGLGLTPTLAPAHTTSTVTNLGANVNQISVDLSVSVAAGDDSPEATGEAVRGVVREELGDMLQSAHKATQPQVQR